MAVRTLNASNTTDVAFEIAVEVAMIDGSLSRKKDDGSQTDFFTAVNPG
jgi:hypothetical protein